MILFRDPKMAINWFAGGRCGGVGCPLPGSAEQALDSAEAAGEFCDIGFGGALLGWLQGQHELAAGFKAPAADLRDVVAVLNAHREVEFAAPQAQAPQRPVNGVIVAALFPVRMRLVTCGF